MKNLIERVRNYSRFIYFRIALIFVALLALTLVTVGYFFVTQYDSQITNNFNQSITVPANVRNQISDLMVQAESPTRDEQISDELNHLSFSTNSEIFVVDLQGKIVGVSNGGENYPIGTIVGDNQEKDREIWQTLKSTSNRDSNFVFDINDQQLTQQISTIVDADTNQMVGAVVAISNSSRLVQSINQIIRLYIGTAFFPLLASIFLSLLLFRFLSEPLSQISKQIRGLANGNLYLRNTVIGNDEIGQLGRDMNSLAKKLQDSDEDLLNEHSRLNSILENMSDGVLVINRLGLITLVNDTATTLLSVDRKNILNKSVIKSLHMDKQKISLRDLFKDEKPHIIDLSEPNKDLIISLTPSIIRRNSGLITGAVLVMHDVTAQEQIELERKNFVSNVSHELRTPLTSVNSYLETLLENNVTDKKTVRQFLNTAYKETQRMIRMVSELLVLSRMDQKTSDLKLETVDLSETINYLIDRFEFNIQTTDEKKYEFVRKIDKHKIQVNIDQDKFAQVIDNILLNAVKYSLDGGKIIIATKIVETDVAITISDQGLGIPKKDLKNIFKRFYRVDKARSRAQGGSGLGLSISKEIVELLNGQISVDSIEGKGTSFTIVLPLESKDLIPE